MKITRITLRHFKGLSESFDFSDIGGVFVGRNGVGKTTIIDAICWCLYGKFSDRTEQNPMPLDENNKVIEDVQVQVKLATDVGTFTRIFIRKYTKSRDTVERKFAGHTTDYDIDGIPMAARDYDEYVKNIISERDFFVSAIPTYFGTKLSWQERRLMLAQMVGEPTTQELAKRYPDLLDILQPENPDSWYDAALKRSKSRLTECNNTLRGIPDRIDENRRNMVSPEISREDAEVTIKELTEKLEQRKQLGSSDKVSVLEKEVIDIMRKISKLEAEYSQSLQVFYGEARKAKDEELANLLEDRQIIIQEARECGEQIKTIEKRVDDIGKEGKDVNEKTIRLRDFLKALMEDGTDCPTCKQPMPKEMREERLKQVKETEAEYEVLKTATDALTKAYKILTKEIKTLTGRLSELDRRAKENQEDIDHRKEQTQKNIQEKEDALRNRFEARLSELSRMKQEAIDARETAKTEAADPEIELWEAEIERMREVLLQHDADKMRLERIKDLEEVKVNVSKEAEKCIRSIYLYELRLRAIAEHIEETVNKHFKVAQFKLFHELVNGEIKEMCEVLYNGRQVMSQGEAIHVGIDICDAFARAWKVQVPLLVDGIQNLTLKQLDSGHHTQHIYTKTTEEEYLQLKSLEEL